MVKQDAENRLKGVSPERDTKQQDRPIPWSKRKRIENCQKKRTQEGKRATRNRPNHSLSCFTGAIDKLSGRGSSAE